MQGAFAAALIDPAADVPIGIIGPDRKPSAKRFSVYRNNVVVGLIEALEVAFPAVRKIVGDKFFRAMARDYAVKHLPASPILLAYGVNFPDWIATFEPARDLRYLADVAWIEWAWLESYHAADAEPLSPEAFAGISPETAGDLRFALHPALRIARSKYPALTIWRMNVDDGVPAPVDMGAGGEDALVTRPQAEVEVRFLPAGGAVFVSALAAGQSLQSATECAMCIEGFDLSVNLAGLISAGAFACIKVPSDNQGGH